ncbi:hypothetical protein [Vibrio parahaemolyticus]|uniref:hypothetical protein n=1 Tax=Vibrio parahaemolyticus TaxID=670 RepID=UPI0015DF46C6|nr:hypothetical protein [Vibrio parahaemolyticus]
MKKWIGFIAVALLMGCSQSGSSGSQEMYDDANIEFECSLMADLNCEESFE